MVAGGAAGVEAEEEAKVEIALVKAAAATAAAGGAGGGVVVVVVVMAVVVQKLPRKLRGCSGEWGWARSLTCVGSETGRGWQQQVVEGE